MVMKIDEEWMKMAMVVMSGEGRAGGKGHGDGNGDGDGDGDGRWQIVAAPDAQAGSVESGMSLCPGG